MLLAQAAAELLVEVWIAACDRWEGKLVLGKWVQSFT